MEAVLEIIKFTIPSLVVFFAVFYVLKEHFKAQESIRRKELEADFNQRKAKQFLPIQMQAYERIILLLERIRTNSLIFRLTKPGMSAKALHTEMLKAIREEFDHNQTQQLYLSPAAWQAVVVAREETVKMINIVAAKIEPKNTAIEFGSDLMALSDSMERLPVQAAIEILKKEFRQRMRLA